MLVGMPKKIARIAYNSRDWRQPSGEAASIEAGTYASSNGFGHEEWLFRSEWQINGWRYAFVQGVNKDGGPLLRTGSPFDLTLFTIDPQRRRRYVAELRDVACLSEPAAVSAWRDFERLGWARLMREEVHAIGRDPSPMGDPQWTSSILNIRFRLTDVSLYPAATFAEPTDPIQRLSRYRLFQGDQIDRARSRPGSLELPQIGTWTRRASPPVECEPEHRKMQRRLMQELVKQYGKGRVRQEREFVDVSVDTADGTIFFEIKSDPRAPTVIREAVGQLLEYAYHPAGSKRQPISLVVVGRSPMTADDEAYLHLLLDPFNLRLEYRIVLPE